jgi:hypothetical protein
VARDAFDETWRAYATYLGAWLGDKQLIEDGRMLSEDELLRRVVEFAGGLGALRRHINSRVKLGPPPS